MREKARLAWCGPPRAWRLLGGVHWCKGPEVDVVAAGIAFSPLYSVGGLRPQGGGGCRGASRSQGQGAVAHWLLGSALPLGVVG